MPTPRNQRNSPYIIDYLAVTFYRSTAGLAWRWRTELTTASIVLAAGFTLARALGPILALVLLTVLTAVIAALPAARRFTACRFWCLVSRHRLQRVCYEARLHTRAGRLPVILRIHPTKVGERAVIWCRAGTSADDFDDYTTEIAAACYAREARITRHKKWSQFITVDIIRRDTLDARHVIASHLTRHAPGHDHAGTSA